ncbi:hypothetical protein GCM10027416_28200 [Okibacterium endophyticum]
MSSEEKSAWTQGVLAIVMYGVYLVVILSRAASTPLTEVPYIPPMLWTIGISIVASIVIQALAAAAAPKDAGKIDQRDKQIGRFGEYVGHWVLVAGALAALGFAMAELSHFWIANVIYLAFVISAIVTSAVRIVAYRRGFHSW